MNEFILLEDRLEWVESHSACLFNIYNAICGGHPVEGINEFINITILIAC